MQCLLCSLIAGDQECSCVYRDSLVFAFFVQAPLNPGHILLAPVEHHTSLTTVPAACLHRLFELAPHIGQAAVRAIDGDGFNLHLANGTCAGQDIPHTHLHIIPRTPTDGFAWNWRQLTADAQQHAELLQRIQKRLGADV
jgi:histidine triad (HIT) family protein